MVRGALRNKTFRKVKVRTPGSNVTIHYKKRKPKVGVCPVTGETLKGVAKARPYKMENMPKSQKRPERPYGGVLSSRAMRQLLKARNRVAKE